MGNWDLGNILYFDAPGAIKSSDNVYIQKIALWAVDGTSELSFSVNGTTTLKFAHVINATSQISQWHSESFSPPLFVSNASIATITAGSGYVYLA